MGAVGRVRGQVPEEFVRGPVPAEIFRRERGRLKKIFFSKKLLFFNERFQLFEHIFLNLLNSLQRAPECQQFPFVAFHIGELEFFHALDYLDIEFFCHIKDDLLRTPGGIRTS